MPHDVRSYGVSWSEAATSASISAFNAATVMPWLTTPLDALLSGRLRSLGSSSLAFSEFPREARG